MNKKGLTTIELITSFALASVIFILLFNVILILKDTYLNSGVKTTLLINQANLSKSINDKLSQDKVITSIEKTISNENKISYKFIINSNEEILTIDKDEGYIEFNGYKYELKDNMEIVDKEYVTIKSSENYAYFNSIVVVDIPIKAKNIDGNYGIKAIYQSSNSIELKNIE